jgi:3-(3-hydroxy-phenyl)propionate hydroxylase
VCLGPNDFLLDHLGGGFDLLYFTPDTALPEELSRAIQALRNTSVPLWVIAIGAAHAVHGADVTLPDAQGRCRARYGVTTSGAAYLLRPDQHVCARWVTLDAVRLQAALRCAMPQ